MKNKFIKFFVTLLISIFCAFFINIICNIYVSSKQVRTDLNINKKYDTFNTSESVSTSSIATLSIATKSEPLKNQNESEINLKNLDKKEIDYITDFKKTINIIIDNYKELQAYYNNENFEEGKDFLKNLELNLEDLKKMKTDDKKLNEINKTFQKGLSNLIEGSYDYFNYKKSDKLIKADEYFYDAKKLYNDYLK